MPLARGGSAVINVLYAGLAILSISAILFLTRDHHRLALARVSAMMPFTQSARLHGLPDHFPDDLGPLRELCQRVDWVTDRVWQCDYASGGMGNVYNIVLGCVRTAIEAGASALIPPALWIRSRADPKLLVTNNITDIVDLSYMFNVAHFKSSLHTACPQMTVYDTKADVPNLPERAHYIWAKVEDFGNPQVWRKNLDAHLEKQVENAGGEYTSRTYDYVLMYRPLFKWPVWDDGVAFANNFKSILHFRADARGLAASILERMRQSFAPRQPDLRYFGAHLRTGNDIGAEWSRTGFEQQYDSYMSEAVKMNLSVVYVGSGMPEDARRFADRAWKDYQINVTTKYEMLSGTDLKMLNALESDQQALVDFEVLSRAAGFGGMHRSSFAWQIAFRKHTMSTLTLQESLHDRPKIFQDEFSHILNSEPDQWFDFFFSCTWP